MQDHALSPKQATAVLPTLSELTGVLRNLRGPWPARWPGLTLVFERAWAHLELGRPRKSSRAHQLWQFGQSVTGAVEVDGARRFALGQEPAYHNRLHIADTLVCMTYLLKASRCLNVPGAHDPCVSALALAIMAGHDFLHPGGSNSRPAEFESQAVEDLQPLAQASGLHAQDLKTLSHCILATDPLRVKAFHQQVKHQAFDLHEPDCLAVLVQEADILASTLPQTQQGLTEALSREWAPTQPDAAGKLLQPQNRLLFLEHAALFTSPAALVLGIDKVKARQMNHIKNSLKQAGQSV